MFAAYKMASPLLKIADRLAATLNCRVIPTWRLERLAFAEHLKALFGLYQVSTVLDVGANVGQYRDFLRDEVEFRGAIHSFEPLRDLARKMVERRGPDTLWQVHPCALGADEGTANINVMASDTFSSLRNVSTDAPAAFAQSAKIARTELISLNRLDTMAPSLNLMPGRTYLKVDTQGFDLEVLAGATKTMPQICAMQLELAVQRIYDGVPDYREVLSLLESLGFSVSGLFPISSDSRLRAVEFDCILVRQDVHGAATPS